LYTCIRLTQQDASFKRQELLGPGETSWVEKNCCEEISPDGLCELLGAKYFAQSLVASALDL